MVNLTSRKSEFWL